MPGSSMASPQYTELIGLFLGLEIRRRHEMVPGQHDELALLGDRCGLARLYDSVEVHRRFMHTRMARFPFSS